MDEVKPAVYVGVDWATEKHDVCVEGPGGEVLGERAFPHSGLGLASLADWITAFAAGVPAAVSVGIEVPHGSVVETLLERGMRVHALNPKQLDRFRDRFTVAGAKDDRRDALVLADSLRTDRKAFRQLTVRDPLVIELREWSRIAEDLGEERRRLTCRLREQLRRFFPQVLKLTDDPGERWILALLEAIPTPKHARRRRRPTILKILKEHRIRRVTPKAVEEILREPAVVVAPGTVEAATAHIRLLRERIRVVVRQTKEAHDRLDQLTEQMSSSAEDDEGQADEQRDVEILHSLPGVGRIVLATLLAEAAQPLADRDYQALRSLCGVAPVTRRSGKKCVVVMRQACHQRLRNAVYHWSRVAAQHDDTCKARYAVLRARGHSHGRACRGVADRLLSVAIAMLRTQTTYDPTRLGSTRKAVAA